MTLDEAKVLTKAVMQHCTGGLKRDFWYWPAMIAHCGALGVLVGSALILSYEFRCCAPRIFWYVTVAAVLYFAGAAAYRARYVRFIALANRSATPAGTRHVVDDKGYTIARGGQVTFIPWRRIVRIDRRPGLVLVATSDVHFWPIAMAAFLNQSVDAFVAELERRWELARRDAVDVSN